VKILLEGGALPNLTKKDGGSALIAAAEKGCLMSLELLLEAKSDVDYCVFDGMWTALHVSSMKAS